MEDETVVEKDLDTTSLSLDEKINNKIWKIRCDGYEQLKHEINEKKEIREFVSVCAAYISKITSDSNPNALDLGLDVAILFFEVIDSAWASCEQEKILNNIVDKTFGARQSTVQRGKALILKVIETTEPSQVTLFLLSKLNDRRPKVPPICIDLITEGVILFGARSYPLKDILKTVAPVFNSSNGVARESVMSLVVELCKWVGLPPLQPLLEGLRPAQRADFDKLVASQPATPPIPSLGLRRDRLNGVLNLHAAPVLEARDLIEELDLSKKLKGTEFSDLIASEKWADQAQGLDFLLNSLGSTPKLKYNSAVVDVLTSIHLLLKTGHIQVQIKCLKLISLFSDACRSKLAAEMRNMLGTVLARSKEKKLIVEVEDSLTMICLHCVNFDYISEDFVELMTGKKNPPNCKVCLCQVILNLLEKNFSLSAEVCRILFQAFVLNSDDSDVKVREISIRCLQKLREFSETSKCKVIILQSLESLQSTNQKLYKRVLLEGAKQHVGDQENQVSLKLADIKTIDAKLAKPLVKAAADDHDVLPRAPKSGPSFKQQSLGTENHTKKQSSSEKQENELSYEITVSVDDALLALSQNSSLHWDLVAPRLASSKWQDKVDALNQLQTVAHGLSELLEHFLVGCTSFGLWKSNNINVVKATVELFIFICNASTIVLKPVAFQLVDLLLEKISDKKLQKLIEELLSLLVQKADSKGILRKIANGLQSAKSPAVHQDCLTWMKITLPNQKMHQIPVQIVGQMCVKEMENKNAAVRSAALDVVIHLYSRAGPPLLSCLFSKDVSQQVKTLLEQEFAKVEVVPTEVEDLRSGNDLPRKDLSEILEKNVLLELNSIEGKDSWQIRKASMERILDACNKSGHHLEFNKTAAEAVKLLKLRLNDTQSNLKPLAAQAIAHLLASFAPDKVVKCLKVVAQPLLLGLTDNKKPMRDSTVSALETIVSLNGKALDESILMHIVLSTSEVLGGSIGRVELLVWLNTHRDHIHGDCGELCVSLVSALQDKTSQVRSECENFLCYLVSHKLLSKPMLEKGLRDLTPAVKRSIQGAVDRIFSSNDIVVDNREKTVVAADQPIFPTEPTLPINVVTDSAVAPDKTLRKEDWRKWPSLPLIPSVYDLAVLKSRWKVDFNTFSGIGSDGQDLSFIIEFVANSPEYDLCSQSDYLFRLISFQISNAKDEGRLETILTLLTDLFHRLAGRSQGGIEGEEIHLFLPFLYSKLSYYSKMKKLHSVLQLNSCFIKVFGSHYVLDATLRGFELIEDPGSRIFIWDFLEELLSSARINLTTEHMNSFKFLKNSKIAPLEKQRCARFIDNISRLSSQGEVSALVDQFKELTKDHKKLVGNDSKSESLDSQYLTLNGLIEDFTVIASMASNISVVKCKEITDRTRIVLRFSLTEMEQRLLFRRLPDFFEACGQILKKSSKVEFSILYCCFGLLNHVINQMSSLITDINVHDVKSLLLSLVEFATSTSSAEQMKERSLWSCVNLVTVKLCLSVNAVVSLTALLDFLSAKKVQYQFLLRLIIAVMDKGTCVDSNDEVLSNLLVAIKNLTAAADQSDLSLCKSLLQWSIQRFGAERIDGLVVFDHLTFEYLKSAVIVETVTTSQAKGDQLVEIIHEITYSKDKNASIKKIYEFKQYNPDIDLDRYLSKLSAPFRKYVYDVFAKFEETENTLNPNEFEEDNGKVSVQSSEALRIIENLKTRPPSYKSHDNGREDESPISRRNERIRDSLSTLSKSLDLPTSLNDAAKTSFSETLEERLLKLKLLK